MSEYKIRTVIGYINSNNSDQSFFEEEELISSVNDLTLPFYSRMPQLKKKLIDNLVLGGCVLNVYPEKESKLKLSAINSKKDIGICVQMGNIANLSTDLLKLNDAQKFKGIKKAIIFLPTRNTEKELRTSNTAKFESVIERRDFYSRHLNFPACICGIEVVN
ncbi:hypothetical protein OAW20_02180 [Gammaproteobacteria bacterium]|nr:hypothetical protein [Gammaproteobacteria bacterium]